MVYVAVRNHTPEVADAVHPFAGDILDYESWQTICITAGEIVDVIKIVGKWALVCRNEGENGWIPREYLKRLLF